MQTMVLHEVIDRDGIYAAARKTKDIGYNALEVSGHFPCTEETVAELCRAKADFGMDIAALNVEFLAGYPSLRPMQKGFQPLSLEEDFDRVVSYCRRMGTRFVRYAGMPVAYLDTMEKLKKYCALADGYALRLKEQGLTLCMHEHDDEFSKIEGKTYYDWVIELAPNLSFEFCVGGAVRSGVDLYDTMEKLQGRMPLLHFTDIKVLPPVPGKQLPLQEKILSCPAGDGNLNVEKFCRAAEKAGNRYFVLEAANFFGEDPFCAMKRAAQTVRRAGFGDKI